MDLENAFTEAVIEEAIRRAFYNLNEQAKEFGFPEIEPTGINRLIAMNTMYALNEVYLEQLR